MMLLLFGVRALERAGQRAVGGARPQPQRRFAALRRGGRRDRLLPAAARGGELRARAGRCSQRGKALALRRDPRRLRGATRCAAAPQVAGAARRRGSAHRRRASAASSAQVARAFDPTLPRRRARAAGRRRRRRERRSTCAGASGSTRRCAIATSSSPRSPACCSRTCASRSRASGWSASARAAPTSRRSRCRRAARDRARQARCRTWWSATACSRSRSSAPGLGFGVWPRGSLLALLLLTLPFVLASLAIGVFVSALARNSAQAVFITVFFIMPSFVLSGVMLPYQLMPDGVRQVGGAAAAALVPDRPAPRRRRAAAASTTSLGPDPRAVRSSSPRCCADPLAA